MKNIELGKEIYNLIKTDLDFKDWFKGSTCFGEFVNDAAASILNGSCSIESGSFVEISKTVSKDGKTHRIDFDRENFIEYYGPEQFYGMFYPGKTPMTKSVEFNGKTYFGRTVKNPAPDMIEELLMFEEAFGADLMDYEGEVSDDITSLADSVFAYVPLEVLEQSDEKVVEWCRKNNIDIDVDSLGITNRFTLVGNKTSITKEELEELVEYKHEYANQDELKKYTEKDYHSLSADEKKNLIEELMHDDYVQYKNCHIARSKLLYDSSDTLIKEISIIDKLNDLGYEVYLLPYGYARDSMNCYLKSADSITNGNFLEFKTVISTGKYAGQSVYTEGRKQADNIFISLLNETSEQKVVNNIYKVINEKKRLSKITGKEEDFSGLVYLNFEKDNNRTVLYQFDREGKALRLDNPTYENLKKCLSDIATTQVQENPATEHGSSPTTNILQESDSVNKDIESRTEELVRSATYHEKDDLYIGDDEHKVRFYTDFDSSILNLTKYIGEPVKDFRLGTVFDFNNKCVDYFIDAVLESGDVLYDVQDKLSETDKKVFLAAEEKITKNIVENELHEEVKNNVWTWENYEDNSGHLRAPDGSTYFSYDWDTKEYKITQQNGWDSFLGAPDEDSSFSAFKEYAEDYVKKFIAKTENIKFDSKNINLEEDYELQNKQSLIEKTIETFNDAGYIVNKTDEKNFSFMLSNLLEIDNYSLSWDDEDGVLIVHNDSNTKEVLDEKVIERLIHNWSVSIKDRNDSEENWQLELLEKTQKHYEQFLHDNKNIVTYSVTFPCGFTFPKDLIGNEEKMKEYRNKVYSELKEKYRFNDNDAETEYFPDEKYPSFNINFAAPVPIESMEPVFATDIWVDNVCEEIEKKYGANFNFQGGERSEREFESRVAVKKEIARLSAEHCGYYKWNDIFTIALETGPQDRELKAKDNAREYICSTALRFNIEIENSDYPEDAIEDFLEKHPEYNKFNEDGSMIYDDISITLAEEIKKLGVGCSVDAADFILDILVSDAGLIPGFTFKDNKIQFTLLDETIDEIEEVTVKDIVFKAQNIIDKNLSEDIAKNNVEAIENEKNNLEVIDMLYSDIIKGEQNMNTGISIFEGSTIKVEHDGLCTGTVTISLKNGDKVNIELSKEDVENLEDVWIGFEYKGNLFDINLFDRDSEDEDFTTLQANLYKSSKENGIDYNESVFYRPEDVTIEKKAPELKRADINDFCHEKTFLNYPQLSELLQDYILHDFEFYQLPLYVDKEGNIYQRKMNEDIAEGNENDYSLLTPEGIINQERCWIEDMAAAGPLDEEHEFIKDEVKHLDDFSRDPKTYYVNVFKYFLEKEIKLVNRDIDSGLLKLKENETVEDKAKDILKSYADAETIIGMYISEDKNNYLENFKKHIGQKDIQIGIDEAVIRQMEYISVLESKNNISPSEDVNHGHEIFIEGLKALKDNPSVINEHLPENVKPFTEKELSDIAEYTLDVNDDLVLYHEDYRDIYRVYNRDIKKWNETHDEELLHHESPESLLEIASFAASDVAKVLREDGEVEKADKIITLERFFEQKETEIRASNFADLRHCECYEVDSFENGIHALCFNLNDYNTDALGLEKNNDNFWVLRVCITDEGLISDYRIDLHDGNDNLIKANFDEDLPDYAQRTLSNATPLIKDYIKFSLPELSKEWKYDKEFAVKTIDGIMHVISKNENSVYYIDDSGHEVSPENLTSGANEALKIDIQTFESKFKDEMRNEIENRNATFNKIEQILKNDMSGIGEISHDGKTYYRQHTYTIQDDFEKILDVYGETINVHGDELPLQHWIYKDYEKGSDGRVSAFEENTGLRLVSYIDVNRSESIISDIPLEDSRLNLSKDLIVFCNGLFNKAAAKEIVLVNGLNNAVKEWNETKNNDNPYKLGRLIEVDSNNINQILALKRNASEVEENSFDITEEEASAMLSMANYDDSSFKFYFDIDNGFFAEVHKDEKGEFYISAVESFQGMLSYLESEIKYRLFEDPGVYSDKSMENAKVLYNMRSRIYKFTPEHELSELLDYWKDGKEVSFDVLDAKGDLFIHDNNVLQLRMFTRTLSDYRLEKLLDPDFDTENDAISFYYMSGSDGSEEDVYWDNHVSESHNSGTISGSELPDDLKKKIISACREAAEKALQKEYGKGIDELISDKIKENNIGVQEKIFNDGIELNFAFAEEEKPLVINRFLANYHGKITDSNTLTAIHHEEPRWSFTNINDALDIIKKENPELFETIIEAQKELPDGKLYIDFGKEISYTYETVGLNLNELEDFSKQSVNEKLDDEYLVRWSIETDSKELNNFDGPDRITISDKELVKKMNDMARPHIEKNLELGQKWVAIKEAEHGYGRPLFNNKGLRTADAWDLRKFFLDSIHGNRLIMDEKLSERVIYDMQAFDYILYVNNNHQIAKEDGTVFNAGELVHEITEEWKAAMEDKSVDASTKENYKELISQLKDYEGRARGFEAQDISEVKKTLVEERYYVDAKKVGKFHESTVDEVEGLLRDFGFADGEDMTNAVTNLIYTMKHDWAEQFVTDENGNVYWHDIEAENDSFEFAEADADRIESVITNCIDSRKETLDSMEEANERSEFIGNTEELESILIAHGNTVMKNALTAFFGEHVYQETFTNSPYNFTKTLEIISKESTGKEHIDNPATERDLILRAASYMIYDNYNFGRFEGNDFDVKYDIPYGPDIRFELCDKAVQEIIKPYSEHGKNVESLQQYIYAESKKTFDEFITKGPEEDRNKIKLVDLRNDAFDIAQRHYSNAINLEEEDVSPEKQLKVINGCLNELEEMFDNSNYPVNDYGLTDYNGNKISFENLVKLIKGRDTEKGFASLTFKRPDAQQLKKAFAEDMHDFKDIINGYFIDKNSLGAKAVVNDISMGVFDSDSDAARQWESDTGGKILEERKDIFMGLLYDEMFTYLDTPENREILDSFLLDKPLNEKFEWKLFPESSFYKMKEDLLHNINHQEVYGSIHLGSMSIDFQQRDDGIIDVDCYILGEQGYGGELDFDDGLLSVPYSEFFLSQFKLEAIESLSYKDFKEWALQFIPKEIVNSSASLHLIKEAARPTVNWSDRDECLEFYSKKLGQELFSIVSGNALSMGDRDKSDCLMLIDNGADARKALLFTAADANMYENCHWFLSNLSKNDLTHYFSDKNFADKMFNLAKESVTNDRESWTAISDIGFDGFKEIAVLCNREKEANQFYEKLLLEEGYAVKVVPYSRDEKDIEAVRNWLSTVENISPDEIGTDKVTAVIDNIGNEDTMYLLVGTGKYNNDFIRHCVGDSSDEWAFTQAESLKDIFSIIENNAENHAAVSDDRELKEDWEYVKNIQKIVNIIDSEKEKNTVKEVHAFTDDIDKMRDFDKLSKEEFLSSYSYLNEEEYDATAAELKEKGLTGKQMVEKLEGEFDLEPVLEEVFDSNIETLDPIIDEAKLYHPEDYGLPSDGFTHVVVEFHNNEELVGKNFTPEEIDELMNNAHVNFKGREVRFNVVDAEEGGIKKFFENLKEQNKELSFASKLGLTQLSDSQHRPYPYLASTSQDGGYVYFDFNLDKDSPILELSDELKKFKSENWREIRVTFGSEDAFEPYEDVSEPIGIYISGPVSKTQIVFDYDNDGNPLFPFGKEIVDSCKEAVNHYMNIHFPGKTIKEEFFTREPQSIDIIDEEVKLDSVQLAGEKFIGELNKNIGYHKNNPWVTTKLILEDMKKNNPSEHALVLKFFEVNKLDSKKAYEAFFKENTGVTRKSHQAPEHNASKQGIENKPELDKEEGIGR